MADLPPYKPGQEVTEGLIYRRIPNRGTYYDYDLEMVDVSAFILRPRDRGSLSALLNREEARASLKIPVHKGFGLCVLDVAKMKAETSGQARVEFAPTPGAFGASHVSILGCQDEEVRVILALIAEIDVEPERPVA